MLVCFAWLWSVSRHGLDCDAPSVQRHGQSERVHEETTYVQYTVHVPTRSDAWFCGQKPPRSTAKAAGPTSAKRGPARWTRRLRVRVSQRGAWRRIVSSRRAATSSGPVFRAFLEEGEERAGGDARPDLGGTDRGR